MSVGNRDRSVRAVVCTALTGENGLEVRDDWPAPGPLAPGQVRIAVEAASGGVVSAYGSRI